MKSYHHQQVKSLGDHAGDEVFIADAAIGSNINLADPLIEFRGIELLADAGEDVAEIGDGDVASGFLVEDTEGIEELTVEGLWFEVLLHEFEESGKFEGGGEFLLGDDVLELSLRRVATKRSHQDAELRCGYAAVAVGVEEGEGLLHRGHLIVAQILTHFLLSFSSLFSASFRTLQSLSPFLSQVGE